MSYLDLKEDECPSKGILGDLSDEDLFKELHTCCNPNCLTIAEVVRRYNNKVRECAILDESNKAFPLELYQELKQELENKKKECEALRVNVNRWNDNVRKRLEAIKELSDPLNFLTS